MRRKKRILVADSYRLSREAITELLTEEGYRVKMAADNREAVSFVSTWKPQLVLIDENLRGLECACVIAQLYTIAPDLAVVLVTDEPPVDAARAARQLGVHDYLTKPVDFTDLLALLPQLLGT